MSYRASSLVLSTLLLGANCSSGGETPASTEAASVSSFSTSRETIELGQSVEFSWEIDEPGTTELTCQLDVQSDGIIDYEFVDCAGTTTQEHVYVNGGSQTCTLTLLIEDADPDSRELSITVAGPSAEILAPATQFVADEKLDLRVKVDTEFDVSAVTATVEDREVLLKFDADRQFIGTLDLDGLPQGPKTLQVTMLDVLGTNVRAFRPISYDGHPKLSLTLPAALAVARPEIFVEALCTDDSPGSCEIAVAVGSEVLATGLGGFSELVDLSAFDGQQVELEITAEDPAGRTARRTVNVFVENSPALEEVLTLPAALVDFDGDRTLYERALNDGFELILRDDQGDTQIVPVPEGETISDTSQAFLTPTGVIFRTNAGTVDWRLGQLHEFGDTGLVKGVAGDYAAWHSGASVLSEHAVLYQFSTGAIEQAFIYESHQFPFDFFASKDGTITYVKAEEQGPNTVMRVVGGATEELAHGSAPSTDGTTYVIADGLPADGILLWKGGVIETLYDGGSVSTDGRDYEVNNGWVVYRMDGGLGQRVLWRRNPAGLDTPLTISAIDSDLDSLGPDGRATIKSGGRRFLANEAGDLTDIGSDLGYSLHIDDGVYVVIGHTILRLIE